MPRDESDERAERDLLELYTQREEVVASLKFAVGGEIAAGQALLRTVDAEIEEAEGLIANVQESVADEDAALAARRSKTLEMLAVLDGLEKEPTSPQAALEKIPALRAEALRFLALDAAERGIPNDDH